MTDHADIQYRPARTEAELLRILEIQRCNQPASLGAEEMARDGFVTLTYSLSLLQKMQAECPQIVAVAVDQVIGYALCLHPVLAGEVPALAPMFKKIRVALPPETPFRVMGQICIERGYRGQGHFRGLYGALQNHCNSFALITEVAVSNTRSLGAHTALGFEVLARREESGVAWVVLIKK